MTQSNNSRGGIGETAALLSEISTNVTIDERFNKQEPRWVKDNSHKEAPERKNLNVVSQKEPQSVDGGGKKGRGTASKESQRDCR